MMTKCSKIRLQVSVSGPMVLWFNNVAHDTVIVIFIENIAKSTYLIKKNTHVASQYAAGIKTQRTNGPVYTHLRYVVYTNKDV